MTVTMTPTGSTSTDDQAPRPLPLWASIPIILVCLAAGGWIIHWYVGTHPRADEAHVLGDLPPRKVAAPGNARRGGGWLTNMFGGGRGIRETNAGPNRDQFDAFTERSRAIFTINPNNKNRPVNVVLNYGPQTAYRFVPDDVRNTVYAAANLARDSEKYAAPLKLTPAQVDQLRQRSRVAAVITPGDRAMLLADLAGYRAAAAKDKQAAEAKLLSDLDAVADRSQGPTRQAFADAAAKINAIVSADQWKQFKAMGGQP
jgi:hypothetical protein